MTTADMVRMEVQDRRQGQGEVRSIPNQRLIQQLQDIPQKECRVLEKNKRYRWTGAKGRGGQPITA